MPHTSNSLIPPQLDSNALQDESLSTELLDANNPNNGKATHGDDWSYATQELLDTLPRPWTRGLLYFLVVFIAIVLPWSVLYKVDETGTARGRLELKGDTVKREADIQGSVAVTKVHVKAGDEVKANQILIELDSKSVGDERQQLQLKLEEKKNRLAQLEQSKNQLTTANSVQQQQNKAQELEKLAQVNQAQQSLDTLKTAYNLQKEEKLTQVAQAQQNLDALKTAQNLQKEEKLAQVAQAQQNLDALKTAQNLQKEEKLAQVAQVRQAIAFSKAASNLANIRLANAQEKLQRYKQYQLLDKGAISQDKFNEVEQIAQESYQQRVQAESDILQAESRLKEQQGSYEKMTHQGQADIKQAQLRLKEQQENYEKMTHQGQADIKQAQLRLKEQQENYQRIIRQAQAEIEQAKLRLKEQENGYQSLIQAGKLAVAKNEQQLNDMKTQISSLQSEIAQTQTQIESLNDQLEKYVIRAPFDGTIFQLPMTREGAVVQPKQLIAEIAPKGTRLIFRGQIPTSESESLRSGNQQKDAHLKFDEYPFQDYEVVKGKLTWVSPDSKITQTAQGNFTTYDLEIELAQPCIQPESKCIPFKSGQPATAEIIIRQRRIIDFILDPFKKLQKGELKL